jgi:hypothetical protein
MLTKNELVKEPEIKLTKNELVKGLKIKGANNCQCDQSNEDCHAHCKHKLLNKASIQETILESESTLQPPSGEDLLSGTTISRPPAFEDEESSLRKKVEAPSCGTLDSSTYPVEIDTSVKGHTAEDHTPKGRKSLKQGCHNIYQLIGNTSAVTHTLDDDTLGDLNDIMHQIDPIISAEEAKGNIELPILEACMDTTVFSRTLKRRMRLRYLH